MRNPYTAVRSPKLPYEIDLGDLRDFGEQFNKLRKKGIDMSQRWVHSMLYDLYVIGIHMQEKKY